MSNAPRGSVRCLARETLSEADVDLAKRQLAQEQDWQAWINQIEVHGLSGFANKHIADHGLPIPDELRLPLKALSIRHKSAAMARHKVLSEIDAIFKEHHIDYLALKGAALAPYIYKQESLRPMRDMDLLLPQSQLNAAADCLRSIGFDLPKEQPSKFMRDMHQLPNAAKTVDGFYCSVELHRDGISREVVGHYFYPQDPARLQAIEWNGLSFRALDDVHMLHQVTRHLEGLHNGAVLKLINVMDVILLAEHIRKAGQWQQLEASFPHVINSLRCLHLLTPLPTALGEAVGELPRKEPPGVGVIMDSFRSGLLQKKGIVGKLKPLLLPSDWWLHLYYNTRPNSSLLWIKLVRHPLRMLNWLSRRIYSRLLGG